MSRVLTISASIFLGALSIGVLGYITNQASLWSLPSRMWQDDQKNKQENKPIKVSIIEVNTDGSTIDLLNTNITINNPLDKHIAICVRGTIVASGTGNKFVGPPYCFSDIPPFTSMSHSIANQDMHGTIRFICYDQDRYNREARELDAVYVKQLSQWQATIDDYTKKAEKKPIYAEAIQILNTKKPPRPALPNKIFSWDYCSLSIEEMK